MKTMYGNIDVTADGMYWACATRSKAGEIGGGFWTTDYIRQGDAKRAANRMAEKLGYVIEWEGEEG